MANNEHVIDAKGRILGRIASETAVWLRGKNSTSFTKNLVPTVKVKIVNASKVRVSPKKMTDNYHKTYSGYPGGLKKETWEATAEKKGKKELIRLAVFRMLPGNKLRPAIMKNLTIEE